MSDLEHIQQRLRQFASDRNWDQFHSPKNLVMALSVEVAELLEHFQWLTESQSKALAAETLEDVTDEIADVQIYLLRLADKLDIDIQKSVEQKIIKNEARYPAEKVFGQAKKYTAYKDDSNK